MDRLECPGVDLRWGRTPVDDSGQRVRDDLDVRRVKEEDESIIEVFAPNPFDSD
jgi:hypothetical protein